MYSNKFVVSLKSDGKVLREQNGSIELPFGNEYSIFLKNLESRTAVVSISIDGEDVLDRNKLVIHPNSDLELKGFMKGNIAKNRFRFIKRTKNIEENRGIHIDDGLIRVKFQFEKMKPVTQDVVYNYRPNYRPNWWWNSWSYPYYPYQQSQWSDNISYGISDQGNNNISGTMSDCVGCGTAVDCSVTASYSAQPKSVPTADFGEEQGITTKGTLTNQQFSSVSTNELEEQSHVIVLKLIGYTKDGDIIKKPVYTREKIKCPICGGPNRSSNRFCYECGTFLQ